MLKSVSFMRFFGVQNGTETHTTINTDGNKSSPGELANLVELANTSTGSDNDSCYGGPLDGACGMGRESIEAYRNAQDS
jgi:hypothetical protein